MFVWREREREIHYVHSASLAYEDGIVFMSVAIRHVIGRVIGRPFMQMRVTQSFSAQRERGRGRVITSIQPSWLMRPGLC